MRQGRTDREQSGRIGETEAPILGPIIALMFDW